MTRRITLIFLGILNAVNSTCLDTVDGCGLCDTTNTDQCFEYTEQYTMDAVDTAFAEFGTRSGCTQCNKCVVGDGTSVTAHYAEGSSTFSNVDAMGYPEGGCQFRMIFEQQYDSLWLEYNVFFHNDFDFVKGGKMPGLYGGTANSGCNLPDGTNGLSTRYMWGPNGYGYLYLYAVENEEKGYECGQDTGKGNFQFPKNETVKVKQFIQLNTPGEPDGVAAVFINDQLKIQRTDITFRTVDSLKIEGLMFSTFFGGGSPEWRATKDEMATFSDFKLYHESYTPNFDDNRPILEDGTCRTDHGATWSEWVSRTTQPSGSGEWEKLEYFQDPDRDNGYWVGKVPCDLPTGAQARVANRFSTVTPYYDTFAASYGWSCKHTNHPDGQCDDIELSFCCPGDGPAEDNRVVLEDGACDTENGAFWSEWVSRTQQPSGSGEYEKVEYFRDPARDDGIWVTKVLCDVPSAAKARVTDLYSTTTPYADKFTASYGWSCKNVNHPDGQCDDIEQTFCCAATSTTASTSTTEQTTTVTTDTTTTSTEPAATSTEQSNTTSTTTEATTTMAITTETTTHQEETTTEAGDEGIQGPVGPDKTIRPFGTASDVCVYKRYGGFKAGHDLWLWNCEPNDKSKKYQWKYFTDSGLIKSIGSTKSKKKGRVPFCWTYFKPETQWTQRLKIIECDVNDQYQQFEFTEGRLHPKASPNLCVGYDVTRMSRDGSVPITLMQCFSVSWGHL